MLRVEVAGAVVRRPGEVDVLVRDVAGRALVAHVRPQLLPGEQLMERAGQIPMIVMEAV
jgi:hypothetical protein